MGDAFVSVLLERLASIILQQVEQEVRLVVGVEEEVGKLTSNLLAIQVVLEDAERRQVKEATVRQWLRKLKDISYDMEDVLDEWNIAMLKMQIKRDENSLGPMGKIERDENALRPMRKVCSFIPSSCFCFRQVALRGDIAVKIKNLNKTLDVISIEKDRYNFTSTRGVEDLERKITASSINVSEVYGRDHDKNTIIDMLNENSQEPTLRIIPIVGMGGIGKTTLAQLVYNDDVVKAHFQKRIWVCVSYPFDEIRIAKEILEALSDSTPNFNGLDSLLRHTSQSIEGKKFLLVLDDVWTEDYKSFEQLKNSLECGSPGSRILVTTRKETVAKILGTTHMFRLGQLSSEECWSLFSQVAFFGRSSEECENLKDIGQGIADKCKGLPLAAKVIGSLLRLKNTRDEWQSVLDSEVWKLEEVEIGLFPPLLLSYYDLSSTMRRCFSYCAVFPKDYKMKKNRLIKLWMAQGYFKETRNRDMEMVGEECFSNLAMRFFFQDIEQNEDNGRITCKIHDIVHDFAQFLTKNECFRMEVNSHEEKRFDSSYVKARHLMMMLASGVSFPTSIYNVKNLRSLIVESNDLPKTSVALSEVFDQLPCLRTLHLTRKERLRNSLTELPKEVGKLVHLRYLNLAGNYNLKELPETVCDLCKLQTLNVSMCYQLKKLPHGLGKLINLRHLEISKTGLCFIPKGVERLTCLRTLDNFYVSSGVNDSEASTLGDLKNLNHLRGRLQIKELGKVRDVDDIKKAQLKSKQHLIDLVLLFTLRGEDDPEWCFSEEEVAEGRARNDEQVIEAIQPPPNLEKLSIIDYRGTTFPNWMMSLTNLKVITIRCWNCELLPPLGKLSYLESLVIEVMGVKRVGIEFLGIEREVDKNEVLSKKHEEDISWSSVTAFPKLEVLNFGNMNDCEEWDYGMTTGMREEQDITTADTIIIMPRLRSLRIYGCNKLKALPDHILHSTSLEILNIYGCGILEERYYKKGKGEDWPKISHIPNIQIYCYTVKKEGRLLYKPEWP